MGDVPIHWVLAKVAGLPGPRIVVVSRGAANLQALRSALPAAAHLEHLIFNSNIDRLHLQLAAIQQPDLILDLCGGRQGPARLRRAALRLRAGGWYVARLDDQDTAPRRRVADLVQEIQARQSSPGLRPPDKRHDRRTRTERDLHALASCLDEILIEVDRLEIRCVRPVLTLVAESDMDDFLTRTPRLGRVVDVRAAASGSSTAVIIDSESMDSDIASGSATSSPPLSLREYRDVVCRPRMVAHSAEVLLPDSFRDPFRGRHGTPAVIDWSPGFAIPVDDTEPEPLAGEWFYLDNVESGHFGHAFTEQLGHLWGWTRALREHPDLGLLMLGGTAVPDWQLDLLQAAGVPRDRIRALDGPVRVETLLATTPGYVIGRYVHPTMLPLYRQIGSHLAETDPEHRHKRVFITRRGERRACRNVDEVEAAFADRGFAIVSPETLAMSDQANLFAHAETVAGFGGSGLFPFICSESVRQLIVVSSDTYHVANEKQLAALAGVDLTVFRSTAETVTDRFSNAMFHSAFTVDWNQEGRRLIECLDAM